MNPYWDYQTLGPTNRPVQGRRNTAWNVVTAREKVRTLLNTLLCRNGPRTKYDSHSESESEDEGHSAHEWHTYHRRGRDSRTDSESLNPCPKRTRHRRDNEKPVAQRVNDRFWKAFLDYRTTLLADKSSHYNDEVARNVSRWTKRFQIQIKLHGFDLFEPISIISFLSAFRLACDINRVNGVEALGLLLIFIKFHAAATLTDHIALWSSLHKCQKESMGTPWCTAVKYLPEP